MKVWEKFINSKYILPALFLVSLVGYFLFYTGEQKHLNYFVPLADAFLNGRLYLLENPSWLNELIDIQGKYYVVYPPMPAILLMPLVFLFGADFPQPLFSILIAGLNVVLCFMLINKVFKSKKVALVIGILYAFGTMMWYHAVIGSAWYIAHIIAMFFIWLALLELFTKKRYFLVGLLIGAAYWSRLPAVLAVSFPLLMFWEDFIQLKPKIQINFKNLVGLGSGIAVFVGLNFIYNFARFGVFYDISYQLLPVFEEPWYKNGLFSLKNIPVHLGEILFALPKFSTDWPYIIPSLNVMALWIITPAYFLILNARFKERIVWAALISVFIMSLPGLMHGSNGFTQFGFRFSLDYLPFFILLIAAGTHKRISILVVLFVGLSILINLWGMILINFYKIWTI